MDDLLPESMLADAGAAIEARSGLSFPRDKWLELRKGLTAASVSLGLSGPRELAERLLHSSIPGEWLTVLLDHLTIGETYFFREPETLEALEMHILPELVWKRRNGTRALRIWSAGCSTGEEPYTLAMLLCRAIPDVDQWKVSVLATDLNTVSLQKAKEGVYSSWSFRGTPEWLKSGFFRCVGDQKYSVTPKIRRLVRFERLNLGSDVYPALLNGTADVDLIFCRNVLMYFSADRIESVLKGFRESLAADGYLVVSANELSVGRFEGFERVGHGRTFCHRRKSEEETPCAPAAPSSPQAGRPPRKAIPPAHERVTRAQPGSARRGTSPALNHPVVPPQVAAKAASHGPAPDTREDLLEKARRCADSGHLMEALEYCRASLEASAMNPAAHYLCSVLLQETGEQDEAVRELHKSIYLDPDFVAAYVSLGHIHRASGKRREAERQFANALAILERFEAGEVIRESGGTTAGSLALMIRTVMRDNDPAGGGGT